jgi:hypothetical protein
MSGAVISANIAAPFEVHVAPVVEQDRAVQRDLSVRS